jgi:hypothetical protein
MQQKQVDWKRETKITAAAGKCAAASNGHEETQWPNSCSPGNQLLALFFSIPKHMQIKSRVKHQGRTAHRQDPRQNERIDDAWIKEGRDGYLLYLKMSATTARRWGHDGNPDLMKKMCKSGLHNNSRRWTAATAMRIVRGCCLIRRLGNVMKMTRWREAVTPAACRGSHKKEGRDGTQSTRPPPGVESALPGGVHSRKKIDLTLTSALYTMLGIMDDCIDWW